MCNRQIMLGFFDGRDYISHKELVYKAKGKGMWGPTVGTAISTLFKKNLITKKEEGYEKSR